MSFATISHLDTNSLPWVQNHPGNPLKPSRREVNFDPDSGAVLWIIHEPAGFRGSGGGNPHYLPVDEEAYFLDGEMVGDPETTWVAGDYLFYPKGFLHSPDDATDTGTTIVMRLSGPMSYVDEPLPPGYRWNRADERQMLPGQANSRRPISRMATGDLPWEDLMLDGEKTGERIKILSEDRTTHAVTFLSTAAPGWRATAPRRHSGALREWLVLNGDVHTGGPDSVTLGPRSYRCLAPGMPFGGEGEGTVNGYLALCWSEGPLDFIGSDGIARTVSLG